MRIRGNGLYRSEEWEYRIGDNLRILKDPFGEIKVGVREGDTDAERSLEGVKSKTDCDVNKDVTE